MDSNSRREAGAAIKPTYRISEEDENEVDQLKSMALERITVRPLNKSSFFQKLKK